MQAFPIPQPLIEGYPFAAFVSHITEHVLTANKFKTMIGVLRAERVLKAAQSEDGVCRWSDADYAIVRAIVEEEHEERALPMPVLMLSRTIKNEDGTEAKDDFPAPTLWFAPYIHAILDAQPLAEAAE